MAVKIDAYKLAYMPLPKAACSSVKIALASVEKQQPAGQIGTRSAHDRYQTRRFRLDRWNIFGPDWFRFCVIRDPFKRLMSCYLDVVVARDELRNSRRLRNYRKTLPTQPDPDFFFQNLDTYRRLSSTVKHHSFHASMFIGDDLSLYESVYRTSDLPDLASDLSVHCQRPVRLPRANATGMRLTLDDLAPETQATVADWLAPDYALLRDYFTSPFGRTSHGNAVGGAAMSAMRPCA